MTGLPPEEYTEATFPSTEKMLRPAGNCPGTLKQMTRENMCRNGMFLSWSQSSSRPDAWGTSGSGTISKESANVFWGKYAVKIDLANIDTQTKLYTLPKRMGTDSGSADRVFTFTMMVKTSNADSFRLYMNDGVTTTYSPYHAGDGEWHRLWVTKVFDSSSSAFQIGIESVTGSPQTAYVDSAMCTRGPNPFEYNESPQDRSPITQTWEDNGSETPLIGCCRIIPFETSGTLTGGARTETVAYTIGYNARAILHVSLNLYAFGGNIYDTKIDANNFAGTGFDIIFQGISGNLGADSYTITGVIYAVDWNPLQNMYRMP